MNNFKKLLAALLLTAGLSTVALGGGTQTIGNMYAAAANILGSTLASNVTASSLTSTGTLTGGATGAGFTVALGTSTVTGVLPAANGGAGSVAGALKANGSGLITQAACSDLSNGATGCSTAVGTSGGVLGLLNANKTDSGSNTFSGANNFTSTFSIGGTAQTFPTSGLHVGTTDTQTLTNKTLTSAILTTPAVGSGGMTLAGATSGTTTLLASGTASGSVTLPAATDTLVGKATTDTLTNKSIAGSEVNSGTVLATYLPKAAADGSTLGVAAFNNTDFSCTTGVCDTIQGIATTSSPSFAGLSLTGNLVMSSNNISSSTGTGVKIATATNQKLGFFNSVPVVQQTGNLIAGLNNLGLVTGGTIAAGDLPVATTLALGAVKPDGTTITISGGVITSSGGSATAVTVGTTSIVSGTTGYMLYNNAGVLGNEQFVPTSHGGTGIDTSASTGVVQYSSGTASVSTALAAGTTATTQSASDNSTKVATTAYVDGLALGGYNAQSTTYAPVAGDRMKNVDFTGSSATTFTLTSAATLGSAWWSVISNGGTSSAILTLKSSSGTLDTIAAATGIAMYPGEVRLVTSDGTNFHTKVLHGFNVVFSSSGSFTVPPGYNAFAVEIISGGQSGSSRTTTGNSAGGAGGVYVGMILPASKFVAVASTETVTVGGTAAGVSGNTNGVAGNTSSMTVNGSALAVAGCLGLPTTATSGVASLGGTIFGGFNQVTLGGAALWNTNFTNTLGAMVGFSTGGDTTSANVPEVGSSPSSILGAGAGGASSSTAGGVRTGGTSVYAGTGGAGGLNTGGNGTNGSIPGGGGGGAVQGGTSGSGAAGQVTVRGLL